MNKIALIALAAAVAVGAWIAVAGNGGESGGSALVGRAFYACDDGKTISAAFYGRPDGKLGTAEVSLDGAASTTLAQTISASGIRYATEDESFVFWSKGSEALVMRDNSMDLSYSNCRAAL